MLKYIKSHFRWVYEVDVCDMFRRCLQKKPLLEDTQPLPRSETGWTHALPASSWEKEGLFSIKGKAEVRQNFSSVSKGTFFFLDMRRSCFQPMVFWELLDFWIYFILSIHFLRFYPPQTTRFQNLISQDFIPQLYCLVFVLLYPLEPFDIVLLSQRRFLDSNSAI